MKENSKNWRIRKEFRKKGTKKEYFTNAPNKTDNESGKFDFICK